jgi:hypothetical protein
MQGRTAMPPLPLGRCRLAAAADAQGMLQAAQSLSYTLCSVRMVGRSDGDLSDENSPASVALKLLQGAFRSEEQHLWQGPL